MSTRVEATAVWCGQSGPSFGNGGKVTTDLSARDFATAMAVQSDGKILVVVESRIFPGVQGFVLARYLPDGSLDPAFGSGGTVTSSFGNLSAVAPAIVLDVVLPPGLPVGSYQWLARFLSEDLTRVTQVAFAGFTFE